MDMRSIGIFVIFSIVSLLSFQPSRGAEDSEDPNSPEVKAFDSIRVALSKPKTGADNPTEPEFVARRVAGNETAELARKFLRDFPNSKKAAEANVLLNVGLFRAAIVGDSAALGELDKRAREAIQNPKFSDEAKEHAFIVNYLAQWAHKNGKRVMNDSTAEGRALW